MQGRTRLAADPRRADQALSQPTEPDGGAETLANVGLPVPTAAPGDRVSGRPLLPPDVRLDPEVAAFIGAMPKAELHIHLEGSIAPETMLALARRHERLDLLPDDDLDSLQRWFAFTDFPHFVRVYLAISQLLVEAEDFATIVHACGADMAAQNIRYRELTFTPFTHTHLQGKALGIDEILEGLDDGRARARRDFGVEMKWVFDVPRNASFDLDGRYDPFPAEQTLLYALRGQAAGSVVGFGLGGWEVGAPPAPFAQTFAAAREAGLLSVPHAGETAGPESVQVALDGLGAQRIGHGVRAIEDAELLVRLRDLGTVLEVNPTSNVRLHVYPTLAAHPFPHLDRMGLIVTVNSDDPPLFGTTLTQEYEVLAREWGYGRSDLARIGRRAFLHAGCEPALRQALLEEFDAWAAANV
jgi:aminodeoxyfutalosine deaminase